MKISYARTCRGKQKHASHGAALAAIRSLARMDVDIDLLQAYFCTFCHRHHVGHRSPSQWQRRKQGTAPSARV